MTLLDQLKLKNVKGFQANSATDRRWKYISTRGPWITSFISSKVLNKGKLKKFFQIFSYYFQKNLTKKRLKGHIVCIYTRNIDFKGA